MGLVRLYSVIHFLSTGLYTLIMSTTMSRGLLYLFVISLIACCIEVDISVPSLPDISDHFDISDGLTQMTIAVNFFGFCFSAAIYGPLSESYGRRRVMIIGSCIMFIGAFGCTIAQSIEFLLMSRFIQGIGASTAAVLTFAMIADLCSGKEAADVIGKLNSLITIVMSAAPIAGGFINEAIGWRGNYGTVFLVAFFAWIMMFMYLPETKANTEPFNMRKIVKDYVRLFTSGSFMLASLSPSVMFAGYMSFITCGSFLYMETFNLPIMVYALHQGFIIACFSLVSQKAGKINSYLGERKSIIYGIIMLLIGGSGLVILGLIESQNPYLVSLSMVTGAIGAAFSYPVIFARSFEIFPEIRGTASSALMSVRMLVTGLFITWVSSVYDGALLTIAAIVLTANILTTATTIYLMKILKFTEN